MDRLGYTDFINKHKTKALIIFWVGILLIFIPSIIYIDNSGMSWSFWLFASSTIRIPIHAKKIYLAHSGEWDISFSQYFMQEHAFPYFLLVIGDLIIWFTIISLVIVLIQHFKHKKICKPLLCLPLIFYIVIVIIFSAITKSQPFIGFYLAIILEVLVIFYCTGFQRFHKTEPHEHEPTDKERIAELERQVAELQKEKDVE